MTPDDFVQGLLKFQNRTEFDFDLCGSDIYNIPAKHYIQLNPAPYAECLFGDLKDILVHPVYETAQALGIEKPLVWINPPYGDMLKKIMKIVYLEAQKGLRAWALIPARTETAYYQNYCHNADFAVYLYGRISFIDPTGKKQGSAPFPTVLLYYGDDWKYWADKWIKDPPFKGELVINYKKVLSLVA